MSHCDPIALMHVRMLVGLDKVVHTDQQQPLPPYFIRISHRNAAQLPPNTFGPHGNTIKKAQRGTEK